MKGEATEAQQFRLGCGSQQRTPSPRQSNESWSLCGKTLSALHLSINKLWFKGPHSFPEMKVLSAENFVVRLFVVRPRTVAVQDVEPFCALSFGSVATQSVPETSAFSNGPNLNFWRSGHSPQVAAHLPPCSSDSPAPTRPCWTRNTTSHVQFREERKLLLWLLWSLGVNQLVTRRARLTQEFGRVARRTNCSGRTCFASFTPAMCPASTQVAWRRA